MPRILLLTFMVISTALSLDGAQLTREQLSLAVVHLKQSQTETIEAGGQKVEVWLRSNSPGAKPVPKLIFKTGTGILVLHHGTPFLVTAAHVAKELSGSAQATMASVSQPRAVSMELVQLVGTEPDFWKYHPTEDIAIHRLSPEVAITKELEGRFLPSEIFADTLMTPNREIPLLILGFPLGLESTEYFSPLSRQTHAASGLLKFGDRGVIFVLEDPSVGGYSGAPCFDLGVIDLGVAKISNSNTICYGVVSATVSDDTGGKLAVVTPSYYLRELLNSVTESKN